MVVTANFGVIYAMRISVLALDGAFDTGLTAVLDAFRVANSLAAQQEKQPPFDVSGVGERKKAESSGGLIVPMKAVTPALKPDWVVVPALGASTPDLLVPALERPDVKQAMVQLRKWGEEGALTA